jgi:hypothetical protein
MLYEAYTTVDTLPLERRLVDRRGDLVQGSGLGVQGLGSGL